MSKPTTGPGNQDPSKPAIPTEEELRQLPRWAIVAFAARCARRVQPQFNHLAREILRKHEMVVERAISLCEFAAKQASGHSLDLRMAADDAHTSSRFAEGIDASRATNVALAAFFAVETAYSADRNDDVDTAANAAHAVGESELALVIAKFEPHVGELIRDFELLKSAAQREKWTDKTAVPPSFFGPMWPDGEPTAWPRSEQATQHLLRQLPMQADLESLPQWAIVALAARCARRVQPLFKHYWHTAPPELVGSLDRAISLVESASAGGGESINDISFGRELAESAMAIEAADKAAFASGMPAFRAGNAAVAAIFTLRTVKDFPLLGVMDEEPAVPGHRAVRDAIEAGPAFASELAAAIRRDFDTLKHLVPHERVAKVGVPPAIFGSMWPNGEPEGWPASPPVDPVPAPAGYDPLEVRIRVPANATDDEIKEIVKQFVLAASAQHAAEGGSGLEIDGIEVRTTAGIPSEVLQ